MAQGVFSFGEFRNGMDASGGLDGVSGGAAYKAINAVCRGGNWKQRPAFIEEQYQFTENINDRQRRLFQRGYFQGAYRHDAGDKRIIVVVLSGNIFFIDVESKIITPIPPPTGQTEWLSPIAKHCWFARHECGPRKYLIIQDGVNRPVFVSGYTVRYSEVNNVTPPEYPTGTAMASCQRLLSWYDVTRTLIYHGDRYAATNPVNDLTNQVSQYFLGDGAHGPSADLGKATAMVALPVLDTGTGMGPLLCGYERGWISVDLTVSRQLWPNLDRDIVRVVTTGGIGNVGASSVALVNAQVFFVHVDGLRTISTTRQDYNSKLDNTPLSREVGIWLDANAKDWEFTSLMNFGQRLLWTNAPIRYNRVDHTGQTIEDVKHRGILAYDFWNQTSRRQEQPAWDGLWTGIYPEKNFCFVEGRFGERERGFVFGRGGDGILRLYEIREDLEYDTIITLDRVVRKRIPWKIVTGLVGVQGSDRYSLKPTIRLETASLSISEVRGRVNYRVRYAPDKYPEYFLWREGEVCSKTETCVSEGRLVCQMPNYREQTYVNMLLGQPKDSQRCLQHTNRQAREGHAFSFELEFDGAAKLEYFNAAFSIQPKAEQEFCRDVKCSEINVCNSDDYEYDIATSELYYDPR